MPLRPENQALVDEILVAHPDGLTLDELSEILWQKPVSYADIDEIIGALEAEGVDFDAPEPSGNPEDLRAVLVAARGLSDELGARPSARQIAERAGLHPTAVLRALRFGRALAQRRSGADPEVG